MCRRALVRADDGASRWDAALEESVQQLEIERVYRGSQHRIAFP